MGRAGVVATAVVMYQSIPTVAIPGAFDQNFSRGGGARI